MKILDLFCGAGGAAMGLHRVFPDAEILDMDHRSVGIAPARSRDMATMGHTSHIKSGRMRWTSSG